MYYFVGKCFGDPKIWYVQKNKTSQIFYGCLHMDLNGDWCKSGAGIIHPKTSREAIRILKKSVKSRLVRSCNLRSGTNDVYCFEGGE